MNVDIEVVRTEFSMMKPESWRRESESVVLSPFSWSKIPIFPHNTS